MVDWNEIPECEPEQHRWFIIAIIQGIMHLICLVCRKREDRKVYEDRKV